MRTLKTLALGGMLAAATFFAPSASAADVGVSIGIGTPPAPIIVDGGYYDHVWVEPVYRTEVYYGSPRRVIVTPGYYRKVYHSGVYVAPRSGFYFGGSWGHHHHHHHYRVDRDRDGYYRRDKPGRHR
jgi:hypothetical protein